MAETRREPDSDKWQFNMEPGTTLDDLVDQDLSKFKIVRMTEVFSTSIEGIYQGSIGFFRSEDLAKVYAGPRGMESPGTGPALILTDGNVGFHLEKKEQVKLFDDEAETVRLREEAKKKLTPEEQKILGV